MSHSNNILHEENFFSKFGQYEFERAKRREELLQDYLEFKQREEENFYNRFSDKKKFNQSQKHVESSKVDSRRNKAEAYGSRLAELENKVSSLFSDEKPVVQRNFDKPDIVSSNDKSLVSYTGSAPPIKELKNNALPNSLDAESNNYEDLKRRLHQITEADKRLNLIEEEYNKLKNVQSLYALDHSNPVNQGFPNLLVRSGNSSKNEEEYSKQNRKDKYRKELESQIAEAERKRLYEKAESTKENTMCSITNQLNKTSKMETNEINPNKTHLDLTECLYFDIGQKDLLAAHMSNPYSPTERLATSGSSSSKPNTVQNPIDLKLKKMQYAEELRKQIEEARAKKAKQKKEDEEYNRKIDEQNCNLGLSKEINLPQQNVLDSVNLHQFPDQQACTGLDMSSETNPEALARVSESLKPNFARGGHGIFGSPLTEVQKRNLQEYKKELAQQIAEKRHFMELKKQKEIELEQRELERIREERSKMQKEFEAEQERKQNKVERDIQQISDKIDMNTVKHKGHTGTKKSTEMKTTRSKRLSKNMESPKCSPKILIGPHTSKLDRLKQFDDETSDKSGCEKMQSILKQLNTLRTQLDNEKSKIESMYYQKRNPYGYNKEYVEVGTCKQRSRPRVNMKAVELFQDASSIDKNRSARQMPGNVQNFETEGLLERPYKEDLREIDQKQIVVLRKQDNYLQELRMKLMQTVNDKSRAHSVEERKSRSWNPPEMRNSLLDDNDSLIKPQNQLDERRKSNSFTNGCIDLNRIAEKNKQRLLRLDAIQLLNEVSDDPESVLERFVSEHDELFSSEHKNNIF
ncbi:unnamed protein product [Schistosoma turkestanicum]|nr:unnamed protein product [Schistosoma turkestanicum]